MVGARPLVGISTTELETLESKWGWIMAFGILLIVIGCFSLGMVGLVSLASAALFGILILVAGIVQVVQAFSASKWSGFFLRLLVGILYCVAGFMMLSRPGLGALTLTWVLGVVFLAGGVFKIVVSLSTRFAQWGWTLVSGIASLILGFLIVSGWPATALWVIGTFVGIDLIFDGWSLVALSLALRSPRHHGAWRPVSPTPA